MTRQPRIVIAGQIPPPMGGQNVMVQNILEQLRSVSNVKGVHLAFNFTKNFRSARRAGIGKGIELIRVLGRLFRLRLSGPIDLLVYPPGGPQNIPLLRDLVLLPWVILCSKKVILHFHAAGIGDRLDAGKIIPKIAAYLYSKCNAAIVMTEYNERDPKACGLRDVYIYPHFIKDAYNASVVRRDTEEVRILYMGHLCQDKGTLNLLKAFSQIAAKNPNVHLELAGEPLPPYDGGILAQDLKNLGIAERVRILGVVSGEEKARAFGRAHIFVFPSVAPYESFGIVMVEAMMWGLPIIASNWRGNGDVLNAAPGGYLFAPPRSSDSLAGAIQDLLKEQPTWGDVGAGNRDVYLAKYEGERMRTALCELIVDKATS